MRGYSPLTMGIMLRMSALPAGFIAPCLSAKRKRLGQMTCTHFASRVERWGEK
jgi:hypothetical protein